MNDLAQKLGDHCKGPAIIVAKPISQNVRVSREGVVVAMQIGNSTMRFNWQTAMTIGQWLMSRGVEAKVLEGETQRLIIEKDRHSA